MTRELTPAEELATGTPHADPRHLLKIEFEQPSALTLYAADRPYVDVTGQEWEQLLADLVVVDEQASEFNAEVRPGTAEAIFFNNKLVAGFDRLSDMIKTPGNPGGYEWAFAKATLYGLLRPGHALGRPLGVYFFEDPTDLTPGRFRVRMSDRSLVMERQMRVTRITEALFPSASKAVRGRAIPYLIGSVDGVRGTWVVDGAKSTLTSALTSSGTTVTLDDATAFATGDKVFIDTEMITLGSKGAYTGTQASFTGCTRSAESTVAAAHNAAAAVYQARTGTKAFRCVLGAVPAGQAVASVTVREVNGHPARTSPTVELAATDLVEGKRFVVINFSAADVGKFHTYPRGRAESQSPGSIGVAANGADHAYGEQIITPSATAAEVATRTTRTISWTITFVGTMQHYVVRRVPPGGVSGGAEDLIVAEGSNATGTVTGSDTRTYDSVGAETIRLGVFGDIGESGTLSFNSCTIAYEGLGDGDSTAEAVIGEVVADVEGIQDDASGSITGAPLATVTRPTDVKRFILSRLYPGTTAEELAHPSWAATRAREAAAGLAWAGVLEYMEFSALRKLLGEQSRSLLFLDGGQWLNVYLEDRPTPVMTFDYRRDVDGQFPAKRTQRHQTKNTVYAYSARDYAKAGALDQIYQRGDTCQDLTQGLVRQPGADEDDVIQDDLELSLVQDARAAANLGAFWLAQWKRQRFLVEFTTFWNARQLEKGDCFAIGNHPILDGHGGSAIVFRVIGKGYPGDGRIRLRGVEAGV